MYMYMHMHMYEYIIIVASVVEMVDCVGCSQLLLILRWNFCGWDRVAVMFAHSMIPCSDCTVYK